MEVNNTTTRGGAQRGLTLIETLTATAVLSVVASLSTGSWTQLVGKMRLQSVSQELAADVQLARSTAVALNQAVRLEVQPQATGACVVAYTGAAGACKCNASGEPVCEAPAKVVTSHWLPAAGPVTVTANVASMRFDPTVGTVTPAGTLQASLADGRALAQVVNIMGRTRHCSPGASVAGVAAC
jgi:type IV fimbrial biogenesis protein FimT